MSRKLRPNLLKMLESVAFYFFSFGGIVLTANYRRLANVRCAFTRSISATRRDECAAMYALIASRRVADFTSRVDPGETSTTNSEALLK